MLTSKQIADAKVGFNYRTSDISHEHDDCIRIAHEWIAAQRRTQKPVRTHRALKHIIEKWGGRYVSQNDVEIAAKMHGLLGEYPYYNISLSVCPATY